MTASKTAEGRNSPPSSGGPRAILACVRSSPWSVFGAFVVVLWLAAQLLEQASAPAPALLAGLAGGLALRVFAPGLIAKSRERSRWSHGLIGVMLGSFLDIPVFMSIGRQLVPFLLVSIAMLVMSVAMAMALARLTATGAAAQDEAGNGLVGFLRRARLLFIGCATPLVLLFLSPQALTAPAGRLWHGEQPSLVPRGDQTAGVAIAFVLAGAGSALASHLRVPSPELLGPMALSMIVTAAGISYGFAPIGIFLDVLVIVVGLEAGLCFDRAAIGETGKVLLLVLVGLLALFFAASADLDRSALPLVVSANVLRLIVLAAAISAADRCLRLLEQSSRRPRVGAEEALMA